LKESTDHQLMLAVRDGDLDKLGHLFERYHLQLYNFFLRQLGNPQTSEDLVQDVFYKMLKYRHTYRGKGKFTTWMFSIAHNTKIDHFRKTKRPMESIDDKPELISNAPNPAELSEAASQHQLLYRALERLSDDRREVLLLSRFQQMKYKEIAEVMGVSTGAVKKKAFLAIRDLQGIFKELNEGEKT
jgi:RNA polymerase sigma-70 factor (ECF subfamily)